MRPSSSCRNAICCTLWELKKNKIELMKIKLTMEQSNVNLGFYTCIKSKKT